MAKVNAKASFKITSGDNVFHDAVSKQFIKSLYGKINSITGNVRPAVATIISDELMNSPTVLSLLGGTLKDDFGLASAEAKKAIAGIIDALVDNFDIKVSPGSNQNIARLSIEILPSNFSLSGISAAGSYQSRGGNVDWLEWLLTRGTQVIISDYKIFDNAEGATRSGGRKVMIPIGKGGDPFRVDPSHAGTEASNFVTRALEPVFPTIIQLVAQQIKKVLE
tara:strand:- start:5983 stop:6648 length:666 start_codon:yes stop_codon:yes gene_type:complete